MKLSMIICMKQWDKQGQEGSRCKLSRNLCSECYFSSGCCGEHGGLGTAPRIGGELADIKPSTNLP